MKLSAVLLLVLVLVPVLTSCSKLFQPLDCSSIQHKDKKLPSGVYTIYPAGPTSPVQAYCDMKTYGGRWTVFQRRMDGLVNFYQPWDRYRIGFGVAAGEYWLGLENIHQLTRQLKCELLVEMEDFAGKKVFARYSSFSVDAECDGFALHVSGFTNGGAGDSLKVHNNMKFTTFDKDQDTWSSNCAKSYLGGFWYQACHSANPNGVYLWGAHKGHYAEGVQWYNFKGHHYSLKAISMKIRPVK